MKLKECYSYVNNLLHRVTDNNYICVSLQLKKKVSYLSQYTNNRVSIAKAGLHLGLKKNNQNIKLHRVKSIKSNYFLVYLKHIYPQFSLPH